MAGCKAMSAICGVVSLFKMDGRNNLLSIISRIWMDDFVFLVL